MDDRENKRSERNPKLRDRYYASEESIYGRSPDYHRDDLVLPHVPKKAKKMKYDAHYLD